MYVGDRSERVRLLQYGQEYKYDDGISIGYVGSPITPEKGFDQYES